MNMEDNHSISGHSPNNDAHAFAVAHGIVGLLKRAFYSWLPFILLWRAADWSVPLALGGGIAGGYLLEACCNRLLAGGEEE
jgi:hypothetical protein